MYNPAHFRIEDKNQIMAFLREYSFGSLFSTSAGELRTASIPFIFSEDLTSLWGHLAIANPLWKSLDGKDVLVVFQGPNHYISPLWYGEKYAVPTWNYLSVLVKGTAKVLNGDNDKMRIVDQLSDFHEEKYGQNWKADWSDPHFSAQLKAIVAFEITVNEVEMKRKLSQNHPKENTLKVSDKLKSLENSNAEYIGDLMGSL